MPLRFLARYLLNNQQLIDKLASSYPIKRAARFTAYLFHRSQGIGFDAFDKFTKKFGKGVFSNHIFKAVENKSASTAARRNHLDTEEKLEQAIRKLREKVHRKE